MPNVPEVLKAIYSRPMHFDAADIARSRSHAGDGARLRRVMTRLLQGVLKRFPIVYSTWERYTQQGRPRQVPAATALPC